MIADVLILSKYVLMSTVSLINSVKNIVNKDIFSSKKQHLIKIISTLMMIIGLC